MADLVDVFLEALSFAFKMFWEILWALILGFLRVLVWRFVRTAVLRC